jgi:SWIM zinc finger
MISNGSESLNRIFKICRCLSVVAIVEGTWYKCINWFDERRNRSMVLVNGKKVWSTKVTKKLNKRAGKSRPHRVDSYGSDRGDYEVILCGETLPNDDFKNFKYIVHIEEDMMSKCTCLKSTLTGIPCSHILTVIGVRKFELNRFICSFLRDPFSRALRRRWWRWDAEEEYRDPS